MFTFSCTYILSLLSLSLFLFRSLSLSFFSLFSSLSYASNVSFLSLFLSLYFTYYIFFLTSLRSSSLSLSLSLSLSSNEQLYSLPLSLASKSFSLPFSHLFLSPRSRSSLNILRLCFCNRFSLSFFLLCTSSIFLRFQSHGRS